MKISDYYIKLDASLSGNPILMKILDSVKNYGTMTKNLVNMLLQESILLPMDAYELRTLEGYKRVGYRLNITSTVLTPVNLITQYPFLARIFIKYVSAASESVEEISALELNTLYKLGYITSLYVPPKPTQIVFDGDSLEYGDGVDHDTQSFPAQLKALMGTIGYGDWSNFGVNGQSVQDMLGDESTQILSRLDNTLYGTHILYVGGGINDLATGTSVDTVYANLKSYHMAAHTAGWKTIASTHTANMKEYGIGSAACETARVELDRRIRLDWVSWGCSALVDLHADDLLGTYRHDFNQLYWQADGEHFTVAGYDRKARIVKPAIEAVAKGLVYGGIGTPAVVDLPPVMVTPVPVVAAGGGSPYAGSLRWFAPDSISTSGGIKWADKSGSTDSAIPTGASPTLVLSAVNGFTALNFNASPLETQANIAITGNQPRQFYAVVKLITANSIPAANLLGVGSGPGSSPVMSGISDLIYFKQKVVYHTYGTSTVGAGENSDAAPVIDPFKWAIIAVRFDGLRVTTYQNSTASTPVNTSSSALVSTKLRIGGGHFNAPALDNYTANIAEVIIRADDSTDAFTANMAYLKAKYNIIF